MLLLVFHFDKAGIKSLYHDTCIAPLWNVQIVHKPTWNKGECHS